MFLQHHVSFCFYWLSFPLWSTFADYNMNKGQAPCCGLRRKQAVGLIFFISLYASENDTTSEFLKPQSYVNPAGFNLCSVWSCQNEHFAQFRKQHRGRIGRVQFENQSAVCQSLPQVKRANVHSTRWILDQRRADVHYAGCVGICRRVWADLFCVCVCVCVHVCGGGWVGDFGKRLKDQTRHHEGLGRDSLLTSVSLFVSC